VDILEEVMLPTVRAMFIDEGPILLVHDNCPIHRCTVVREWFQNHPDVIPLYWPSKSPDMNPIENIWAVMTNEWEHQNERTQEALERHVTQTWESLRRTPRICYNIVDSMPRRIEKLIENQGRYTKY
jgi:transposase